MSFSGTSPRWLASRHRLQGIGRTHRPCFNPGLRLFGKGNADPVITARAHPHATKWCDGHVFLHLHPVFCDDDLPSSRYSPSREGRMSRSIWYARWEANRGVKRAMRSSRTASRRPSRREGIWDGKYWTPSAPGSDDSCSTWTRSAKIGACQVCGKQSLLCDAGPIPRVPGAEPSRPFCTTAVECRLCVMTL